MKDVVINIGHSAVAKVLMIGVQLCAATILARNLTADDYGIVGFANIIMALLLRLNGMGLTQAVIRSPALTQRTLGTAATLNMVFSVLAFLCAQLLAPVAGWFLNSPASVPVVRVLAFGFLLNPLGFLPTCLLNREMRFGALRTPSVIGAGVRGVVAVAMALSGWKYWSLVYGNLMGTLTANSLLQVFRRVPFHRGFNYTEARKLLNFGVPITLVGLVTFVVFNADSFLIGLSLGTTILGYYTVALTWATFSSTVLQEVVHSVLFPKFSQMQTDVQRMRDAYLRTLKIVAFSAALMNIGLFVVADGFLVNVLGKGSSRWLPAYDVLRILCVYGFVRAVVETVGNPIMAFGESNLLLKASTIAAVVEVTLLPLAVRSFGILGASFLVTVAYSLQCIVYVPFLAKTLRINFRHILEVLLPSTVGAVGGVVLAYAWPHANSLSWGDMLLRGSLFAAGFVLIHELLSGAAACVEVRAIWRSVVNPSG